jgi:ribosomal protein S27E
MPWVGFLKGRPMPITTACPKCVRQLQVADEHAGKHVRCPICKQVFQVSDAGKPPPQSPPEEAFSLSPPVRLPRDWSAEDDEKPTRKRKRRKRVSLVTTAYDHQLSRARNTLLWVGIAMIVFQGIFYFVEMGQVKDQIQKEVQKVGGVVDPAKVKVVEDAARIFLTLFHGCAIAVGIAFVALSFFVQDHPVPITVAALSLFAVEQVIFVLVDPLNIARGWIIKIIVVVALVKALQAGIAAQKEANSLDADAGFDA